MGVVPFEDATCSGNPSRRERNHESIRGETSLDRLTGSRDSASSQVHSLQLFPKWISMQPRINGVSQLIRQLPAWCSRAWPILKPASLISICSERGAERAADSSRSACFVLKRLKPGEGVEQQLPKHPPRAPHNIALLHLFPLLVGVRGTAGADRDLTAGLPVPGSGTDLLPAALFLRHPFLQRFVAEQGNINRGALRPCVGPACSEKSITPSAQPAAPLNVMIFPRAPAVA